MADNECQHSDILQDSLLPVDKPAIHPVKFSGGGGQDSSVSKSLALPSKECRCFFGIGLQQAHHFTLLAWVRTTTVKNGGPN